MMSTLRVNEIFYSIQGEGSRMGRPCVFVRLTGCHLRCNYCDTEYAFKEGGKRSLDEIIQEVCAHPARFVEITGGEPLLQPNVHELMTRLCDLGKTVAIETSGACDISSCDERVIRIMDIKTPGSGEVAAMDWHNIARLRAGDEVKFVITDRRDYVWAKGIIEQHRLTERVAAVLLSAVFQQPRGLEIAGMAGLELRSLAEWILADGLEVVLQPQLHKFIWEPQTRGV